MSTLEERSGGELIKLLGGYTPHLWAIAIVFYGGGDLVTTAIGLSLNQPAEIGPLTAVLYHRFGIGVVIPLKLSVFAIVYCLWKIVPPPHRLGVPLGLATFGVLVTIWNTSVIYAVIVG